MYHAAVHTPPQQHWHDSASLRVFCRRKVDEKKPSWPVVLGLVVGLLTGGAAQAQSMVTAGQFAVSPSGAATYSIPITVPPGVAGMQPSLALSYSSQAGNGPLGMGWALSGMSAITRCPRTMAQDGVRGAVTYDRPLTFGNLIVPQTDRFCLDGQRLILVSGTYGAARSEYRTEVEGFSRITYDGQGFVVQSKAGVTSEYGKTEDSRIEAQGVTPVRVWALNRMIDSVKNCMTYKYEEDNANGDFRLSLIDYAGTASGASCLNTNSRVELVYINRTDTFPQYSLGSLINSTKSLRTIKTWTYDREVRQYILNYAAMDATTDRVLRLQSVQECAANGECLPPVAANYTKRENGSFHGQRWTTQAGGYSDAHNWSVQDMNGDGMPDLVNIYEDQGNLSVDVHVNKHFSTQKFSRETWITRSGVFPGPKNLFLKEMNGDGLIDIVKITRNGSSASIQVYVNTRSGFVLEDWLNLIQLPSTVSWHPLRWDIQDMNGDGLGDVVLMYGHSLIPGSPGWVSKSFDVFINNGQKSFDRKTWYTGWSGINNFDYHGGAGDAFFQDVNGDGFLDWVTVNTSAKLPKPGVAVLINKGDQFSAGNAQWTVSSTIPFTFSATSRWFMQDVNGDGLADLVQLYNDGGSMTADVLINRGAKFGGYGPMEGSFLHQRWAVKSGGYWDQQRWFVLDADGDGLADLVNVFNDSGSMSADVHSSLGRIVENAGFKHQRWATKAGGFWDAQKWFVQDVDSDGLPDLVNIFNDNGSTSVDVHVNTAKTVKLDRISYGAGMQVEIHYDQTRGSILTPSEYPRMSYQTSYGLVAKSLQTNGAGGMNETSYRYGPMVVELGTGRGMLGFQNLTSTELASGIQTYTEYRQDWPFTGMPSVTETHAVYSGGATLLKRTQISYACQTGSGAACEAVPSNCNMAGNVVLCNAISGARVLPYAARVTEHSRDLMGVPMPSITTDTTYDAWGNVSTIKVQTTSGDSTSTKQVNNEYFPAVISVDKWILGRLRKATATSTLTAP